MQLLPSLFLWFWLRYPVFLSSVPIAALIFGNWKIMPTLGACLLFGFARSGGYELVKELLPSLFLWFWLCYPVFFIFRSLSCFCRVLSAGPTCSGSIRYWRSCRTDCFHTRHVPPPLHVNQPAFAKERLILSVLIYYDKANKAGRLLCTSSCRERIWLWKSWRNFRKSLFFCCNFNYYDCYHAFPVLFSPPLLPKTPANGRHQPKKPWIRKRTVSAIDICGWEIWQFCNYCYGVTISW